MFLCTGTADAEESAPMRQLIGGDDWEAMGECTSHLSFHSKLNALLKYCYMLSALKSVYTACSMKILAGELCLFRNLCNSTMLLHEPVSDAHPWVQAQHC